MDRREIFNILFKGSAAQEPITPEPDPVLETPVHLKTDQLSRVYKEWTDLTGEDKLDLSTSHAFTITLDLDCPDNQETCLTLGIQHDKTNNIRIGLKTDGYLFINDLVDERIIDRAKLFGGFQLILAVNPLGPGMSFAKLKIMDRAGLTLSALKSKQYATEDWDGGMILAEQPFNFLRIEGLHTHN